jgi:hypothetical protein
MQRVVISLLVLCKCESMTQWVVRRLRCYGKLCLWFWCLILLWGIQVLIVRCYAKLCKFDVCICICFCYYTLIKSCFILSFSQISPVLMLILDDTFFITSYDFEKLTFRLCDLDPCPNFFHRGNYNL